MTQPIATAAEAGTLIHRLQEGVWQLAALAVALGADQGRDPEHKRQAQQVMVELGLMSETSGGVVPAPGLAELLAGRSDDLPATSAANILQNAGMLSGATAVSALAWLPAPFVPRSALEAGLPRLTRAVVPGGWLMHSDQENGPKRTALTRGAHPLCGQSDQAESDNTEAVDQRGGVQTE